MKHLFKTILISLSLLITSSVIAESEISKYPGYLQGKNDCGDSWNSCMVCKPIIRGYTIATQVDLLLICDNQTNINILGEQCTHEEFYCSRNLPT